MKRTITIVVDEAMNLKYVLGGYELDEAGLAFTSKILRTLVIETERALIRKQIEAEAERRPPGKAATTAQDQEESEES